MFSVSGQPDSLALLLCLLLPPLVHLYVNTEYIQHISKYRLGGPTNTYIHWVNWVNVLHCTNQEILRRIASIDLCGPKSNRKRTQHCMHASHPLLSSHQWKSNGTGIYRRLSDWIDNPVKKLAHAKSIATILLSIPKFEGCKWMQHARTCRLWHLDAFGCSWRPARGQTSTDLLDFLWRIMGPRCRCNTLLQMLQSQSASHSKIKNRNLIKYDQIMSKLIISKLLNKCSHFRIGTFFSWARTGCCEERCLLKHFSLNLQGGKFQCTAQAETFIQPHQFVFNPPQQLWRWCGNLTSEAQNVAQQTSTNVKTVWFARLKPEVQKLQLELPAPHNNV